MRVSPTISFCLTKTLSIGSLSVQEFGTFHSMHANNALQLWCTANCSLPLLCEQVSLHCASNAAASALSSIVGAITFSCIITVSAGRSASLPSHTALLPGVSQLHCKQRVKKILGIETQPRSWSFSRLEEISAISVQP